MTGKLFSLIYGIDRDIAGQKGLKVQVEMNQVSLLDAKTRLQRVYRANEWDWRRN